MSPQIISLLITIFAGVLMLLPVVWGAIRGLKKSTFRFIWTICFGVVCFFVSGLIAQVLVNIDISFLNLNVNGTLATTLPKYIQLTIESSNPQIATMFADNPDLVNLCVALGTTILKLVLFEILFWVTKWLFWPIWAIISHALFGKKKSTKLSGEQERQSHIMQAPNSTSLVYNPEHNSMPQSKELVQKKRAGLGALVGLLMGIFVVLCTFVPLAGLNNIVMQLNSEVTVQASEAGESSRNEKGILENMLGENAIYLNVYQDSMIGKAFKYTGIEFVQIKMCDYLTSVKYKSNNISLTNEISSLIPVYQDFLKVKDFDFENITQEKIAEILPAIDDAQKRLMNSSLVDAFYNELFPYLANKILNESNYFIQLPSFDNEEIDEIVRNVVKNFAGITENDQIDLNLVVSLDDIMNDLSKVIQLADKLNSSKLLVAGIQNKLTLEFVQENISVELGESILDDLLSLSTISRLLSDVVEPSLELAIDAIPTIKDADNNDVNVEYVTVDGGLSYNDVKEYLKRVVRNGILVVKNIDFDSPLYVASNNFANLGMMIDGLENDNILNETTFNSLINYLSVFLDNQLEQMSLDVEIKNIGEGLIDTLQDIESFESELGKFGGAYQKYLNSEDGLTIECVFEMLDEIKSSTLYTENINSIISNATSLATRYITENDLPISADNLGDVIAKIANVTSFAVEYEKIEDLVLFVKENIVEGSAENLLSENVLTALGQKIDDSIDNQSVLLDSASCKILIKNIINKATLPEDFADKKSDLIANVNSIVSFEDELTAVAKALEISDIQSDSALTEKQKLVALGEVIDDIKSSNLFGSIVVSVVKKFANDEVNKQASLDADIKLVITTAIDSITATLNFENEFGYMYDLMNNADLTDISTFNSYLKANLINANDGSSKSGIITRGMLFDLVIIMADDLTFDGLDISAEIVSCLNIDKNNSTIKITDVLDEVDDLTAEIDAMCEMNIDENNDESLAYINGLGKQIDDLANYALILNANAVNSIGNHITDKLYDNLSAGAKSMIQATYDAKTTFASFDALYQQFASDLGYTA